MLQKNKLIKCWQWPNGMEIKIYLVTLVTSISREMRCYSLSLAVYTQKVFSTAEHKLLFQR